MRIIILFVLIGWLACVYGDEEKQREVVVVFDAEEISKISRLSHEEVTAYLLALSEPDRDDAAKNEIINLLRRSDCKDLETRMLQILESEKETERFKSYVIQHLGVSLKEAIDENTKNNIMARLKKYLNGQINILRSEAFMALLEIKDQDAIKLLRDCLRNGDDTFLLKTAIRYAYLFNQVEYLEWVRGYVDHENKAIKLTAIYYLGQWKDKLSEIKIRGLLDTKDPQIREAAQLALKIINNK